MKIYEHKIELKCSDASEVFAKLRSKYSKSFLLESKDVSNIYGRLSLIGVDPALEIIGKNNEVKLSALNERGEIYLSLLGYHAGPEIRIVVEKDLGEAEESERTKRKNITIVIRELLEKFAQEKKCLMGLYGAFSYDFVRLFEDLPELLDDDGVADFRLCLYDNFIFFDHLKERAKVVTYRMDGLEAHKAALDLEDATKNEAEALSYKISGAEFDLDKESYEKLVENAKDLARRGELFEVVYSNTLRAKFEGDPFALYQKYRLANPSPYLFFYDFADEQLVGASPEMMVRYENGIVNMRPISGTAKRGKDPIEDHENMLKLLANEKERSELDMLIDLGRNDLARICEPGIEISDYRFVEKYSKVMHTVAHLSGRLKKGFKALDALIACMNAGTLTGAPKVAAMTEIEKNETSRRGYYGGAVGYLSFSGEMDTGIIIRTAHIHGKDLSMRAGATLLYDSDPEAEYQETLNKAEAFLTTFAA